MSAPLALAIAAFAAGPACAQELRGFAIIEGNPGYLTNAYLDPFFATWAPDLDAGFGSLGGTGLLEWSDDRTTASALAGIRWIGFTDSTSAWWSGVLSGGVERRLGGGLAVALNGSFSELRRPDPRRTLSGRAALRWTASPRVRVSVGPAVGRTRITTRRAATDGGGPGIPPIPGPGVEEDVRATAASYLLFARVEAWPGARWRVEGEAYAARTDADDLGLDYRGGGGVLRLTRWTGAGVSMTLAAGAEGFGYRAALDGGGGTEDEVPEDELILRGELGAGWPLAEGVELRARLGGLGRPGAAEGADVDVHASLGLRVTLGGTLSSPRRAPLWSREPDGMRIRVPYEGEGRLHLVGDFNGWDDPGLPLVERERGVHTATLRLEPGSYRYRVRVVEGGTERWLDLPAGTPVEDDGFGGRNGVVVVPDELVVPDEEDERER